MFFCANCHRRLAEVARGALCLHLEPEPKKLLLVQGIQIVNKLGMQYFHRMIVCLILPIVCQQIVLAFSRFSQDALEWFCSSPAAVSGSEQLKHVQSPSQGAVIA